MSCPEFLWYLPDTVFRKGSGCTVLLWLSDQKHQLLRHNLCMNLIRAKINIVCHTQISCKNWLLTEELSPVREYGFWISAVLPVPHPFIKRAAMQEIHSSFIFK